MKPIKFKTVNNLDIYFKLIDVMDDIVLIACLENGQPIDLGNIIRIDTDTKKIIRFGGVNFNIGINLDPERKIKVSLGG